MEIGRKGKRARGKWGREEGNRRQGPGQATEMLEEKCCCYCYLWGLPQADVYTMRHKSL